MSNIISYHPKMLRRWAKVFVDRHLQDPNAAISWAKDFFTKEDVEKLVPEVKKELRRRGK